MRLQAAPAFRDLPTNRHILPKVRAIVEQIRSVFFGDSDSKQFPAQYLDQFSRSSTFCPARPLPSLNIQGPSRKATKFVVLPCRNRGNRHNGSASKKANREKERPHDVRQHISGDFGRANEDKSLVPSPSEMFDDEATNHQRANCGAPRADGSDHPVSCHSFGISVSPFTCNRSSSRGGGYRKHVPDCYRLGAFDASQSPGRGGSPFQPIGTRAGGAPISVEFDLRLLNKATWRKQWALFYRFGLILCGTSRERHDLPAFGCRHQRHRFSGSRHDLA